MMFDPEYYGDYEHTSVQRKNHLLWTLLKTNKKLSSNGRAIVFQDPDIEEVPIVLELAKALKRIGVYPTSADMLERIRSDAEVENLEISTGWQILYATPETRESCQATVVLGVPVDGYKLVRLSKNTPGDTVRQFQALQEASGVAPVPGYAMRGHLAPCVCLALVSPEGTIASTAFAIKSHHPKSRLESWSHIGFLATREELRGQGLSKYLLAQLMIDTFDRLQSNYLWTGVKPDNVPSQAVCLGCGMVEAEWTALFVCDPNVISKTFTR